ncbi:AAA family ATPase [Actinoplanes sp. CA-051413]|uniref:AAA family ATPase n=1 Tax=Actinoplanes sp. CA-051413 TaxID=3239899 RepID=UPI003D99527F
MVGRETELAVIEDRLGRLGERGSALIVRGEAGVGKSALLDAARRSATARGLTILSSAGRRSETRVAFAGLHRLLLPVLAEADRLPVPQRTAVQAAFGVRETPEPNLFMIALATLELLSGAAAGSPLLLVIEDAELLDDATFDVLTFVARRLEHEPICMLIAARDGAGSRIDDAGLPEIRLGPLDDATAALLLDATADGLPLDARRRILAEALGNPLALIELPRAAPAGSTSSAPLPLTQRLERAFAISMAGLSAPVRALLLVAALDDGGDQERILSAASILAGRAVGAAELVAAQAVRAFTLDGDALRFRHPLVRSAVYQGSPAAQRRAAHQALAGVYAGEPDRAVRHRAAALLTADDRVAAELEAAGERAARRGAAAEAVTALERAARLSTGDLRRGRRLLRAARIAYDLGQLDAGTALVHEAQHLDLPHREMTTVRYLLELGRDDSWSGEAGIQCLVEIAGELHRIGDTDAAAEALQAAAARCWWESPDQRIRDLVRSAAERLDLAPADPRSISIRAQTDPIAAGSAVLKRISGRPPDLTDPVGMYHLGSAANAVWAYDVALPFLAVAVDGLRAQRLTRLLARALVAQAWAAVHLAREPLAVSAAEEGMALARDTGQPRWAVAAQLAKATIFAERGDFAVAEALTRQAEAVILPAGATPMLALAQFVRGRGAVAHQHYAEGLVQLRRTLDPAGPGHHPYIGAWGLSDLVEAAAHTGAADEARAHLRQLEDLAAKTSGSLLLATAGYARAISAGDDTAEALFERAIGRDLTGWHCYRGRMLLWYGRWLRRRRRITESRVHLHAALDIFDALAFAELARTTRQELRASGERPEHATPDAWAHLTPQELRIARLAATGETNRAIGEQLFLSPRTVQSHLYRIFPKLGITARNQLRDVMSNRDRA